MDQFIECIELKWTCERMNKNNLAAILLLMKAWGTFFSKSHEYRSFKRHAGKFVGCDKEHKRYPVKCHCKKDKRKVRPQQPKDQEAASVATSSAGAPSPSDSSPACFEACMPLSQCAALFSSKRPIFNKESSSALSLTFVQLSLSLLCLSKIIWETGQGLTA